ncbi:MAG: DUF934 domain-containing protein [Pseudomonadota bacterium]
MPVLKRELNGWQLISEETIADEPASVSVSSIDLSTDKLPARISVPNDVDVLEALEPLRERLGEIHQIVLTFPAFTDGRAYSQAFLLRQRFGFTGDIRASGNVLRDQALFMARSGFSSLEFEKAPEGFVSSLAAYSAYYQRGADGTLPVWTDRHSDALGSKRRAA